MTQTLRIARMPRPSQLFHHVSARLRSLDMALDEVREVLSEYGLDSVASPRNLPTGRRNYNVAVHTAAGKKLLKRYRPQWQADTVMYEHSILSRLAATRFPAPPLVRTRRGETFVSRAGYLYALFDFVEGANVSANFLLRAHRRKLMALAGQTLARLHRQLKGFAPDGFHHMGFPAYAGKRRRDMAWHVDKVGELKEKSRRLTDPELRQPLAWLIQHGDDILEEIERLDRHLETAPLPRLVIHGDYGLHNLLFQGNGTVTPVDFELSRLEWRLSDLVSCLSRYRYGNGAYDFESIGWFVTAYHAEYPLDPEEWALFPEVWRFYKLQSAVQYWNSFFQTRGPARKLLSARDAVGQADWALHHPDQLLALTQDKPWRWSTATMRVQQKAGARDA